MLLRRFLTAFGLSLILALPALAQLPSDSVMLDKVKIAEKIKSDGWCPVYNVASDEKLPTWEYKGIKYRGSKPDAQEKFMADPDKMAKQAEKDRFVQNFMLSMSTVWCPVTDEITPGGMTQWTKLGFTFESCCSFCDENFKDQDFVDGLKRLKDRATESYKLMGAKYTEGAKSPVEGAMKEVE